MVKEPPPTLYGKPDKPDKPPKPPDPTPIPPDPTPIPPDPIPPDPPIPPPDTGDLSAMALNVKDFGAVGDGTTDDTAAIQACFDAAFGAYDNPHGGLIDVGSTIYKNQPVYFPPGYYKVSSAIADRPITGAANNGSSLIRLAVDTSGLASGDNINVAGVAGTTEANGSWFVTVVDTNHCDLMGSSFAHAYSDGGSITTPCLKLRSVQGGVILGGGRMATQINSVTANAAVICTNGFAYSRISGLTFAASPGGICWQLDWMYPDPTATVALQSNTFEDCFFNGGAYGIKIGAGLNMGSETLIKNCYINNATVAGLYTGNYNSCDNSIIGGNIAGCAIGVLVGSGSVNTIHGVSLQNQKDCDIYIINGAQDAYSICGCRSESVNFLKTGAQQLFHLGGCNQTNSASGYFHSGSGYVTLDNCGSVNGFLEGNPYLIINNCEFQRSDYLTAGADNFTHLQISPQRVTKQTGAAYTIGSADGSSKIQFDSAAPQTVTLVKNSDNSCRLAAGSKIEVQQIGDGQVSFTGDGVTIRSSNGLALRAKHSCATLTCDDIDCWTLTGDTTAA